MAHQYAQQQVPRLHPPERLEDDHRAPTGDQGQPAEDLPEPHRRLPELLLQGLTHHVMYPVYSDAGCLGRVELACRCSFSFFLPPFNPLSLISLSPGSRVQVAAPLSVSVPRQRHRAQEVWPPGLQYPLRVHRRRPAHLHQPAAHVPGRIPRHPIQGRLEEHVKIEDFGILYSRLHFYAIYFIALVLSSLT